MTILNFSVVGAGQMESGIAHVFAQAGLDLPGKSGEHQLRNREVFWTCTGFVLVF